MLKEKTQNLFKEAMGNYPTGVTVSDHNGS